MARTRSSVSAKVSSGKSSKAKGSAAGTPSTSGQSGSSNEKSGKSNIGGNPVCQRDTPEWQKPITNFLKTPKKPRRVSLMESNPEALASAESRKRLVYSDEEDYTMKPVNKVLDETIHLEPLVGTGSHKISCFFSQDVNGNKTDIDKDDRSEGEEASKRDDDETNESDKVKQPLKRLADFQDEDGGSESKIKRKKLDSDTPSTSISRQV